MKERKKAAFRVGIIVLIGLAVLTAIEFFLQGLIVVLFIIGLLKAALILQFFMHLSSLWSREEGH